MLFRSIYHVTMRSYRTVSFLAAMVLQGVVGLVPVGILVSILAAFTIPDATLDVILIVAMGFFSVATNVTIVIALKFETVGIVSCHEFK